MYVLLDLRKMQVFPFLEMFLLGRPIYSGKWKYLLLFNCTHEVKRSKTNAAWLIWITRSHHRTNQKLRHYLHGQQFIELLYFVFILIESKHTSTAIYLSSGINRWIYTDIHKYTFLICILIFEIILCLCKGLSLLDEGTQQFQNTYTTQLNIWKKPYWYACTIKPTNLSILGILRIYIP